MGLGIFLCTMLGIEKDILFALTAVFAPIMLLLGKGIIDSDESGEEEE